MSVSSRESALFWCPVLQSNALSSRFPDAAYGRGGGGMLEIKLCILLRWLPAVAGHAVPVVGTGPAAQDRSAGPWQPGQNQISA